jgi:HK97 family phage major capsid protein
VRNPIPGDKTIMSNYTNILEQRLSALNSEFDGVKAERAQLRQSFYVDETLPADQAKRAGEQHQRQVKDLTKKADDLADDLADVSKRLAEQNDREATEIRAAKIMGGTGHGGHEPQYRTSAGGVRVPRVQVLTEEPVYREDDAMTGESSFFRDVTAARRGDWQAAERLHRNNDMIMGQRALSTGAGAGGQFAPPLWLVSEWVKLARPSRVTADLLTPHPLPYGVSSINLPSVATGTAVAVQATQNTGVQNTDLTTSSVSSGLTTIAGQEVVPQQLLDQSGIPFDQIVLGDLAADYSMKLDAQVISGAGTGGTLKGLIAWGTAATWTQASPVVAGTTPAASFQAQVTKVSVALANTRFAPTTHLVMSPERWGWITEAVDLQGRPLVPPASSGGTLNSFGSAGEPTAEGLVGTFAGLPVYVDPALTVASGNETVLIMRASDAWLWESELYVASFDAPYANSLGVLFRAHAYSALVNRYPASVQAMTGSGLAKVTLG